MALIITIIVLLILAGVTISAITGNESAMQKAQQAKQETDAANELEEIKLAVINAMVNGIDGNVSAENLKTALTGVIDNTSGITGNGPTWTITGKSGTNYKIDSYGQVEKLTSQSSSSLEPGIYDENNQIVWTWDEFLGLGVWNVDSNGVLAPIDDETMAGETALGYASRIKKVVIPDSVTSIGCEAFLGCTSLSSIEIPSSVTRIDNGGFAGLENLSSIEIPSSVTSIGDLAFWGCTSLRSVEIQNGVTSIGEGVFEECTSLSSITIHKNKGNFSYEDYYTWGLPTDNCYITINWDDQSDTYDGID